MLTGARMRRARFTMRGTELPEIGETTLDNILMFGGATDTKLRATLVGMNVEGMGLFQNMAVPQSRRQQVRVAARAEARPAG